MPAAPAVAPSPPAPAAPQLDALLTATRAFAADLQQMTWPEPVHTAYHPLDYAFAVHAAYLARFAQPGGDQIWLLGMNPGPFGMVQTGVPFGEVASVRDWMGLAGDIRAPQLQHPKRPVQGWQCPRSEVSGRRLWGWAKARFGTPEAFRQRFFVVNDCPVAFVDAAGRNLTPDKLPQAVRAPLQARSDVYLRLLAQLLQPTAVVGIGRYAYARAQSALAQTGLPLSWILHPSPASPHANRGWAAQAQAQLTAAGLRWRVDSGG